MHTARERGRETGGERERQQDMGVAAEEAIIFSTFLFPELSGCEVSGCVKFAGHA